MFTEAGIFLEIGVGEQDGPLTLRMLGLQMTQTVVSLLLPSLKRIKQKQVIPRFVQMLVVAIVACQARQVFLTESQVIEFILEDNTRMEKSVLNDIVASSLLLVGEGNLRQIVFTLMGVLGWREFFLLANTVFGGLFGWSG